MHPRLTILLATFLSFHKTSTVSNQVKSFILQIYRRTRHFVVKYDGTVSILKRGKFQRPSSPFLPEKGRIHGSNPRTPPPYRIVVTRFRVSYRGQKCDGSNLGQCLRRDTPPSTGRNLTNGLQSVHAEIVHVYACACVRVRAIPAQVHVLLTISNCTEGRARKNFSLCPSILPSPRENGPSLQARRRKSLELESLSVLPPIDEIRGE